MKVELFERFTWLIKMVELLKIPLAEFAGTTRQANAELKDLFSEPPFDTPKPTQLIEKLISLCANENADIVMDFFAGSGTTGHAVTTMNESDKVNRRYILVQLQEPLDPDNKDQAIAAKCCDQIGKPRLISELTKDGYGDLVRK